MKKIGQTPEFKKRYEKVVFESEMMRAGFAAFPYIVLKDTKLSSGARLTYAVLLAYAWQEGSTFVGQSKMAKDLGCSVRQLQRYLDELKSREYIDITRKDKRFGNTYIIKDVKTKLKAKD
jgi:hypothetical protein